MQNAFHMTINNWEMTNKNTRAKTCEKYNVTDQFFRSEFLFPEQNSTR